jgi:hypothetical protein
MKIIRASDISNYRFCQRAWWYQLQGYESQNQADLYGGSKYHEQHGRTVMMTGCLNTLAIAILILGLAAVIFWLVGRGL